MAFEKITNPLKGIPFTKVGLSFGLCLQVLAVLQCLSVSGVSISAITQHILLLQFWFRANDLKKRLVKAMREGFEEVLSRYPIHCSLSASALT